MGVGTTTHYGFAWGFFGFIFSFSQEIVSDPKGPVLTFSLPGMSGPWHHGIICQELRELLTPFPLEEGPQHTLNPPSLFPSSL